MNISFSSPGESASASSKTSGILPKRFTFLALAILSSCALPSKQNGTPPESHANPTPIVSPTLPFPDMVIVEPLVESTSEIPKIVDVSAEIGKKLKQEILLNPDLHSLTAIKKYVIDGLVQAGIQNPVVEVKIINPTQPDGKGGLNFLSISASDGTAFASVVLSSQPIDVDIFYSNVHESFENEVREIALRAFAKELQKSVLSATARGESLNIHLQNMGARLSENLKKKSTFFLNYGLQYLSVDTLVDEKTGEAILIISIQEPKKNNNPYKSFIENIYVPTGLIFNPKTGEPSERKITTA